MLRTDATRRCERGFSYLEVMVATVITIAVILSAVGAVASTLHAAAIAQQKMALEDDALNVLADVRAMVAYGDANPADRDTQLLPRLYGRTVSRTSLQPNGVDETISIAVDVPLPGAMQAAAQVTASANGVSVTERQMFSYEAPAPGSSVTEQ